MVYLGIDVGGTGIKAGFVDDEGVILDRRAVATPTDPESFARTLRETIAELVQTNGAPAAVGIGCKGVVNPATNRVEIQPGAFGFLENLEFAEILAAVLPPETPFAAANDAHVALVGEMMWGAARDRRNAVLLTLGTGVGGAVLAEGQLLRGAGGVAGHLGHLTIEPNGKLCICGNHGCLETVFSARAIEAAALDAIRRGCTTVLTGQFAPNIENLTCEAVFAAAKAGDAVASMVIAKAIGHLGAAIAGLLHTLDPEVVIIGGNIAQAGEQLFAPLRREVEWRTSGFIRREVPLVPPEVRDTSGIVGAAALAMHRRT